MTSYGTSNDSTTTTSPNTTTTHVNPVRIEYITTTPNATSTSTAAATTTTAAESLNNYRTMESNMKSAVGGGAAAVVFNEQNNCNNSTAATPTDSSLNYDCDCDSSSDGREKADMTPENIKKIDEIIEQQQKSYPPQYDDDDHHHHYHHRWHQQHQHHPQQSSTQQPQECRSPIISDDDTSYQATDNTAAIYGKVGLAIAIDDSNEKTCRVKSIQTEKNRLHLESCETSWQQSNRKNNNCDNSDDNNKATATTNTREITDRASDRNVDGDGEGDESSTSISQTTTATSKQSLAFTIDAFNAKDCDPAQAAAKYKTMMERFQNRHRRGASLSKLESTVNDKDNELAPTPVVVTKTSPAVLRAVAKSAGISSTEATTTTTPAARTEKLSADASIDAKSNVKLRARDRSKTRIKDASKRHSWSPHSSSGSTRPQDNYPQQQQQPHEKNMNLKPSSKTTTTRTTKTQKTKSNTTPPKSPPAQRKLPPRGTAQLVANRTPQFQPRSQAMQLALKDVDFMCAQPPLAEFKPQYGDDDEHSDTGTYVLDGGNYTEEQKEIMSIDMRKQMSTKTKKVSAGNLKGKGVLQEHNKRQSNVLEVNYYHEPDEDEEPKAAEIDEMFLKCRAPTRPYRESKAATDLEKGKLQNAGVSKKANAYDDTSSPSEDDSKGVFTSVTTSGVLAKQTALYPRPKLTRSSLTTSHVDSSEYVSAARSFIESPPETPSSEKQLSISGKSALSTAPSKQAWINEWARNVRARSLAQEREKRNHRTPQSEDLMTQSYTCADTSNDMMAGNNYLTYSKQLNASKLNKTLAERLGVPGDLDFSSDPALFAHDRQFVDIKPPKSPTKIPSPMHTLGRTRSATRPRASLQQMLLSDDDENPLQKTAAAINNLQESLSRKNSLKSPPHLTPTHLRQVRHARSGSEALYSPEDYSPQHSLRSQTPSGLRATQQYSPEEASPNHSLESPTKPHQRSPLHRASGLMTSSINEQHLQLLTSGEYLIRQLRARKNSLDNTFGNQSPVRRASQQTSQNENSSNGQTSPLRRSSSFSMKSGGPPPQRAPRQQYQNIYTPPTARHNHVLSLAAEKGLVRLSGGHSIKKSASSNNFENAYSDYDDNLQYYINDQDDDEDDGDFLGEDYYTSDDDNEPTGGVYYKQSTDLNKETQPLSNARSNKALLMRIERSKQKVTGKVASAPTQRQLNNVMNSSAGMVACPNTPELPRRGVRSANSRQSVPRDTSLSRLANQVPQSLASAKKQLLQTAAAVPSTNKTNNQQRSGVQPKYLDISKYKPAQSNNFLRKNDARSTLKPTPLMVDIMKRSPSSSSMSRADPTRSSNRSIKSAMSCMSNASGGGGIGGGAAYNSGRSASLARSIRDSSTSKQKEAEMAMWKRRSTYDPMKAAAEDRRRKEEAKRMAKTGGKPCESSQLAYNQEISLEEEEEQWALQQEGDEVTDITTTECA